MPTTTDKEANKLPRHALYTIIYSVMFGVCLATGGSILEPFPAPYLYTSMASFWVGLILSANKLILQRPFSCTAMYVVASFIACFTLYLAPFPSPLKLLFILGGLAFDLGTRFKDNNISRIDLVFGHALSTAVGFFFSWVIIYAHAPELARTLTNIFLIAAPFHLTICICITLLIFPFFSSGNELAVVREIRRQVKPIPKLSGQQRNVGSED